MGFGCTRGYLIVQRGRGLFVFAMRSVNIAEQDGVDESVAVVVVDYNPYRAIFLDSGRGG